jgi:magnesium-protoporphyrin O-methyltransferase
MTQPSNHYLTQRQRVETYFDRTAADAWARLTSDAPVSAIRATVRAGRDSMRSTLLSWLPDDLRGRRILDAGCGTGSMAIALAARGAQVIAVDLSPTLITIARARLEGQFNEIAVDAGPAAGPGIYWHAGDLLDPSLGQFTDVISMDCLIHYSLPDCVTMLGALAARTQNSLLFTFAPSSPLLRTMHWFGRLFPRKDQSPNIVPVAAKSLQKGISASANLQQWHLTRTQRVSSGFYKSQAVRLDRQ